MSDRRPQHPRRTDLMSAWIRNTGSYLAAGYVLFFGSERLFWSTHRPGDPPGDLVLTWLVYSVLACVFLNVVVRFRVRTVPAMFLAGALYGWLAEGALVGTLYGTDSSAPFPMSVVWTGLSWHALITVLVGWMALGRALRGPGPGPVVGWATAIGCYWGAWAPFQWREDPPLISTVPAFAAHALACSALWMLSWIVLLRMPPERLQPGRFGLVGSLGVLAVFYSTQVRALGLRPLWMLPSLLAGVLALLTLNRRQEVLRNVPAPPGTPPPLHRVLLLLITPAVATTFYAAQQRLGLPGIAPIHFFRAEAFLAVVLLAGSVFQLLRPPQEGLAASR